MFEFTIEYCFERYHTGNINTQDTRTAIIYADSRDEAIAKLEKVDNDYIFAKNISFREMAGE